MPLNGQAVHDAMAGIGALHQPCPGAVARPQGVLCQRSISLHQAGHKNPEGHADAKYQGEDVVLARCSASFHSA